MLSRLRASLRSTPRLERDAATVELALAYARQFDVLGAALAEIDPVESSVAHRRAVASYKDIGRMLEATLDRLGMSPGARPAVRDGGQVGGDPDSAALDRLRADAAAGTAGVDYAAAVDPAVTAADA